MTHHIGCADDFESAAATSRAAGCFDLARVYSELALARADGRQAVFRGLDEFHTHSIDRSAADRLLGTRWFRNSLSRGVFHHERADWVQSGKALCGASIKNPALTVSSPSALQRLCKHCLEVLP